MSITFGPLFVSVDPYWLALAFVAICIYFVFRIVLAGLEREG